jgi:hypothetical protein
MAVSTIGGNVQGLGVFAISVDVGATAPAISAEQTFTAPGVKLGDLVFVNTPAVGVNDLNAGLGVAGSRVTAADTIGIRFINATVGSLNPTGNSTYSVLVVRPESGTFTGFAP